MLRGETTRNTTTGRVGENLAVEYLEGLKYRILDRNIRQKFGEIDILAKDKNGTLCFVEVKTVEAGYSKFSGLEPEDHLDHLKLLRMKKMAEWYSNCHEKEIGKRGYRIDLVCVKLGDERGVGFPKNSEIKLYTNLI